MTVESAGLDFIRGPFDYAIAEKSALLEALASNGRSLQHEAAASGMYMMPIERRQGVHSNGVYYWHDYPKADRLTLHPDWADHTPVVNEKYDYLWRRFAQSVTEPGEKIFVISSTQHNLPQFAADEAAFTRASVSTAPSWPMSGPLCAPWARGTFRSSPCCRPLPKSIRCAPPRSTGWSRVMAGDCC